MAVMNIWLEMARSQFQSGDLDAALGSIDRTLQVESTAEAWALKEQILTEKATRGERAIDKPMGVADGGNRVVEGAVDLNSDWEFEIEALLGDRDWWTFLGFSSEERLSKIERLRVLAQDAPAQDREADIWQQIGRLLHAEGNSQDSREFYCQALISYEKAIEVKPDYHFTWNGRGNVLSALNRKEEAIASYEKAIEIKPDKHEAWYSRGYALNNLGQYEEAITSLDKAIELNPDYHDAWHMRGIILCDHLGIYEEAIISFDQAVKIRCNDYMAWSNRAVALRKWGRNEEAIKSDDKAIEFKPDCPTAWSGRGLALYSLGRNEEAIDSYDKAIALKPDDPSDWSNRGLALYSLGRNGEAIDSCDKAIELNPDDPSAWSNRGLMLSTLGRNEEAIESYKKAIEFNPDDEAYCAHGLSLCALGRNEEAIESYEKAIEFKPKNHNAWYARGNSLYVLGQKEEAITSLGKAVEINPDYYEAWYGRGAMLCELGQYEEAIGSFDKVIEVKLDNHDAWYNRGVALNELGRYEEAIGSFNKVIEITPDKHDTWVIRGNSLSEVGRYEEAIASYKKAICINPDLIEIDPDLGTSLNHQAVRLNNLGEFSQALAITSSIMKINPNNFHGWYVNGFALDGLYFYEEAIASYEKSIAINPDQHHAWYGRGSSLSALNRNEEAIASYEKSIECNPDFHDAWYCHGSLLDILDRREEAIASYEKAIEIKPDLHAAWYVRGMSLDVLGRKEEAIGSYEKAIEIKPNYYDAWYSRGVSLHKLGEYEEATVSYEKAIEIKPDHYYAWWGRGSSLSALDRKEEAIACYEKSIEIKPDDHQGWDNRGIAVASSRSSSPYPLPIILKQRPANLHHKYPELNQRGYDGQVASLTVGLTYYCPAETHPLGCGFLQRCLGNTHSDRAQLQRFPRPYYFKALKAYDASLAVLTIADHPEERLQTLQRLVRVHFALNTSTETLTALIRQGAELRDRILTQVRSQPQRDRLHRTLPNFNEFTVDLYLRQGETIRAIETAEADKNGLMQWLLPSIESPTYPEMQDWIGDRTVIYWHFSANALTTFILNAESDRPIVLHHTNPETALKQRNELETWIENWNKNYNTHLETSKKETNKTEKTRSEWQNTIETELEKLAKLLDIPTLTTHLNPSKPLILIPHRDLHRLPLPSFFPDFLTTTIPSIQLGRNLRWPQTQTTHLLNIPAPSHQDTSPLPHSSLESTVLAQLFQTHTLPIHTIDRCTLPQLQTALPNHHTHLHFNGHAYYNDQNPKQSALALSGTDRLTVADLESIDLQHYHLITLASCETALTGNHTITAEYVGLVSAFLSHRIPHILSTLWSVQSNASALLILQFYRQLLKGNPPAQALRHSQRWLRTLTNRKLHRLYRTVLHHITSTNAPTSAESRIEAFLDQECSDLGTMEPNQKPYQDPYFWAAFILAGRH